MHRLIRFIAISGDLFMSLYDRKSLESSKNRIEVEAVLQVAVQNSKIRADKKEIICPTATILSKFTNHKKVLKEKAYFRPFKRKLTFYGGF
jgi:hypothetical protein